MKIDARAYETTLKLSGVEHSFGLGRPSCFRGCLSLILLLRHRHELVENVTLAFLSYLILDVVLVPFWQLYINAVMN